MKESHIEGVAIHDDPESCAASRKAVREVLTGAHTGSVLSREITSTRHTPFFSVAECGSNFAMLDGLYVPLYEFFSRAEAQAALARAIALSPSFDNFGPSTGEQAICGRSIMNVASFLAEMQQRRAAVCLHQQNIDDTTAAGKAMLGMATVFAEFERSVTTERTRSRNASSVASGTLRMPTSIEGLH